jgi:hypothetical protein
MVGGNQECVELFYVTCAVVAILYGLVYSVEVVFVSRFLSSSSISFHVL